MNSLRKKGALLAITLLAMVALALPTSAHAVAFIFGGKIQKDVDIRDFLPGGSIARRAAQKALGSFGSSRYFEIYEKHEGKTYRTVTSGLMVGPCVKGNNILGIGLQVDLPFVGRVASIAIAFCNNLPSP